MLKGFFFRDYASCRWVGVVFTNCLLPPEVFSDWSGLDNLLGWFQCVMTISRSLRETVESSWRQMSRLAGSSRVCEKSGVPEPPRQRGRESKHIQSGFTPGMSSGTIGESGTCGWYGWHAPFIISCDLVPVEQRKIIEQFGSQNGEESRGWGYVSHNVEFKVWGLSTSFGPGCWVTHCFFFVFYSFHPSQYNGFLCLAICWPSILWLLYACASDSIRSEYPGQRCG